MDNKLISELERVLPEGMEIPKELKMLYDWIESHNFAIQTGEEGGENEGFRMGYLFDVHKRHEEDTDDEAFGGTYIEFFAGETDDLEYWVKEEYVEEAKARLCYFATSGGDGSRCALWKDEAGKTQIVHLGSGSGSITFCTLGKTPVDFLRLLAIGYEEICWSEDWDKKPNEGDNGRVVHPNVPFQNWVRDTFKVEIPEKGIDVVIPYEIGDEDTPDAFTNWCNEITEE